MRFLSSFLCILFAALGSEACAAEAQSGKPPAPKPPPATGSAPDATGGPPADANQPPPKIGWATRCISSARRSDLECSIEQTAVLKTGQIVVQFSVTIPAATKAPIALVQVPLGIFLPAGVRLEVDDGKPVNWPIQTCDQRGCYASAPLPPDLLGAMKTGRTLTVTFMTMAKEAANIPLQLAQFGEAYAKIE